MKPRQLIEFLDVAENLKCIPRHCVNLDGNRETVADHSWRLALMALLCEEEYPDLDMNRVIRMCLIHDLGEALTGDIPSFFKTEDHEAKERQAWEQIFGLLSEKSAEEFRSLFLEMEERKTEEAKLFKALDNMEAVLSHNESPLSSWIPLEYEENLVYGNESAAFSAYTRLLREELRRDTEKKLKEE